MGGRLIGVLLVALVLCSGAIDATKPIKRIHQKQKALVGSKSVAYTAVPQLTVSTDYDFLTTWISGGLVVKSTTVMYAWQAGLTSTETVREIHTLAGGEDGVVSGKTWVFNALSWSGFADWASTYSDDIADSASIDLDTGIVSFTILSLAADEPSEDECTNFATAIAAGDLAAGMVIASSTYTKDLNIDESSVAYTALTTLAANSVLLAERLDTQCLGYKFFSYYDAVTALSSESVEPTFSD